MGESTALVGSRLLDSPSLDNPSRDSQLDSQLLEQASKDSAVRNMYTTHRKALFDYVVAKCGLSKPEAEDVMHSAFARYFSLENPDEIDNLRAFLFKAAYHIAIDRIRHQKVTEEYANSVRQDELYQPGGNAGPEKLIDSRESLSIIARVVGDMPAKRRKLLIMHRFEHLSYAEISRRVGICESGVRKQIAKAIIECHRAVYSDRTPTSSTEPK